MRAAVLDPRLRFLTLIAVWSVALLVMLRSPLGAQALVAPLVALQTLMAIGVSGGSPVTIDLSCSGSDVIAISMAAILAYPVAWRRRLTGLAAATVWLGCLNFLRIMTLVAVAGSPLFLPLHLYVLPGLMIAGAAGFVFNWMRQAEDTRANAEVREPGRRRSFTIAAGVLVVGYVAVAPWLMQSASLHALAVRVANVAAALLRVFGMTALTGGSTLVVAGQPFLITPECLLTPLMPVYLAWALTWPPTTRARLAAAVAFVPLFVTLSLLRLMTVALPAMVGPPLFLTHGFYQIVLGLLVVLIAARWRTSDATAVVAIRRFALAAGAGLAVAITLAKPYAWIIEAIRHSLLGVTPHMLSPIASASDVQGATAILPAYQLGLLVGLFVALFESRRWPLLPALLPVALALQVLTLVGVGEAAAHLVPAVPAVAVRALAVAGPLLVVAAAVAVDRRRQRA